VASAFALTPCRKNSSFRMGLTVLYSERPGLPLVAGESWFCTPEAAWNPVNAPGLASMTARIAAARNDHAFGANKIADRARGLGAATLNSGAGTDTTTRIDAGRFHENFPECAGNCWRMWRLHSEPFPPVGNRAGTLRTVDCHCSGEKDEPFSLATRVLDAALYGGAGTTYGFIRTAATTESIKAIFSRDDLETFSGKQELFFRTTLRWSLTGEHQAGRIENRSSKKTVLAHGRRGRPAPARDGFAGKTTDAKLILCGPSGELPQTTLVCFSMGLARSTAGLRGPVEVMETRDLGGLFLEPPST